MNINNLDFKHVNVYMYFVNNCNAFLCVEINSKFSNLAMFSFLEFISIHNSLQSHKHLDLLDEMLFEC